MKIKLKISRKILTVMMMWLGCENRAAIKGHEIPLQSITSNKSENEDHLFDHRFRFAGGISDSCAHDH